MFQTKILEKNHIFCVPYFFPPRNHSVYEIILKSTVDPARPQITLDYGAWVFACWITKATDTYLEYVELIVFPPGTLVT